MMWLFTRRGGEHLEQQTITKIQFQKSQIRRTKMAPVPSGVGLRRWLGINYYLLIVLVYFGKY